MQPFAICMPAAGTRAEASVGLETTATRACAGDSPH